MRDNWEAVRLGDVANTRNGAGVKQENFAASGIPLARISDFTDGNISLKNCLFVAEKFAGRWANYILQEGDVVIATVGSWPPNWASVVGKVVRITKGAVGAIQNQNTCCVIAKPGLSDQRFLFYTLRSKDFLFYAGNASAGSANQARLPVKNIENYSFLLPTLDEQRRIAHILGTLDDKIELNRRQNETLENLVRALFQSWFVNFDPVQAKASGEIETAICQNLGMSPQVLALFPAALEDSGQGRVPAGWENKNIGDLTEANAWTLGKKDDLPELDYIEISEVSNGNVGNVTTYERGVEPSRARRRLRHGDTVLSTVRPDRGAYFLAINPSERLIASTGFAVFSPTVAPWSFVYTALTMPKVFEHLGKLADGAAYPVVHPATISAWPVAYPSSPDLLEAFHAVASPLLLRAEFNRQESRTLAAMRDELLPRLLSGELSTVAVAEQVYG